MLSNPAPLFRRVERSRERSVNPAERLLAGGSLAQNRVERLAGGPPAQNRFERLLAGAKQRRETPRIVLSGPFCAGHRSLGAVLRRGPSAIVLSRPFCAEGHPSKMYPSCWRMREPLRPCGRRGRSAQPMTHLDRSERLLNRTMCRAPRAGGCARGIFSWSPRGRIPPEAVPRQSGQPGIVRQTFRRARFLTARFLRAQNATYAMVRDLHAEGGLCSTC